MEMAIPNSEVRYIYKNTVLRWFEEKTDKKELSPLYESILNGDTEKMEEILSENLMETISFYDYQESYYHGFLAGMLKNIGNYIVLSNRESGNGRPDIILKYPSVRYGFSVRTSDTNDVCSNGKYDIKRTFRFDRGKIQLHVPYP